MRVFVVIGVFLLVVDGEVVRNHQAAGRAGEPQVAVAIVAVGGKPTAAQGRVEGAIGREVVDVPASSAAGPPPLFQKNSPTSQEANWWASRSGRC